MSNVRNHDGQLNVLGNKIRYYRELNKYSYQKLSDKLMLYGVDIHKQALYKIEKGTRTVVDYEICAFALCFNINVEELLGEYYKKMKNL